MSEDRVTTVSQVLTEQETFNKLIESNKKTTFYARIAGISAAIICLVFIVAGVIIIPKAAKALNGVNATIAKAETSLDSLDTLADELIKTANNMNQVVEDNADGLADALTEINNIDIETLNKAIGDLHDTVEPMAKFFNAFK